MPRDYYDQVYGLISSRRFAEALHVTNKILKKQPNYLLAKVWKCEVMYNMGNIAESEDLMSDIVAEKPTDKRTLENIALFYRARGNYSKLIQVYEDALKNEPNDENWRKMLFECCGLAGDYKKQQQQALLLYKQSSVMLFYCMAVVCLIQQADDNPVALELAERMMQKQVVDGKLKSRNETLLLITVYEKRKKLKEAYDMLLLFESDFETLFCSFDKKIELLKKLERFSEVIIELKKHLIDKPDSWSHYESYIDAVLTLEKIGGTADDQGVDDNHGKATSFLNALKESHPKLRGPFLASIKLNLLHEPLDHSSLKILLTDYFNRFGAKAICSFDLGQYVTTLPKEIVTGALNAVINVPIRPNAVELQTQLGAEKHVSLLQIEKLIGKYVNVPEDEIESYCEDLTGCFMSAGDSERKDQYLILLAQTKLALFRSSRDSKHLVSTISQLEDALSERSCIFGVQVLLLQLYFAIGATKAARKLYEQLRIQSIQVDTLSHLLLTNLAATGHFSVALEMWETALKILLQCTVESAEALAWCYRAGLFHRVDEFTRCALRFQRTLTVPLVRVGKAHLEVVMTEPSRVEQLLSRTRGRINWERCLDNRDFSALNSWDPPSRLLPQQVSFNELVLFCKLQEITLLCLSSVIAFSKSRSEICQKNVQSNLDELHSVNAEAYNFISEHRQNGLWYPSTRLHLMVKKPLHSLIQKLLETDVASTEKVCATLKQSSNDVEEIIISNRNKDPRFSLETAVTELEMLAVVTVVCGFSRSGLQPAQRRRSENVVKTLDTCWSQLDSAIAELPCPVVPPASNLETLLRENYSSAVDDMKKVIRKKLAYLHKLE